MAVQIWDYLNTLDVAKLEHQYRTARPTRFFSVDEFLRPDFARACAAVFPSYAEALTMGKQIHWLNERVKVQICDSARFAAPLAKLNEVLSSAEFLAIMSQITGLPDLRADATLAGGGIHVMGRGGLLDLHVDFNLLRTEQLHRRLNILVYLTPDWRDAWDGRFELWDPDATRCEVGFLPLFNRCVVFNTTEDSFHGVNAVLTPEGVTRNSFASYYYTVEPPDGWDGQFHDTIYRARPDEYWKGWVQMPAETASRAVMRRVRRVWHRLTGREL